MDDSITWGENVPSEPPQRMAWSDEADRLQATEGDYCDFVAFERWMESRAEKMEFCKAWREMDIYQRIDLYGLFNAATETKGATA